jgi:spore coat polysaccharide biosynthesis predicted glycosyltransferase SpsG
MSGVLLCVADSGIGVGHGHVMRTLALCEEWVRVGGSAVVITPTPDVRAAPVSGVTFVKDHANARAVGISLDDHHPTWLVIDGYGIPLDVERTARRRGTRVLVIDDFGLRGADAADLVVDQNEGTSPDSYETPQRPGHMLLGPRYALLRSEFRAAGRAPSLDSRRRVLFTFGGQPSDAAVELVERLLPHVPVGLEPMFLAGDLDVSALPVPVRSIALTAPDSVRRLMDSARVAVSAAGSTVWELCARGVPQVLVSVAANQQPVAAAIDRVGAGRDLGVLEEVSIESAATALRELAAPTEIAQRMHERATTLVDAQGAARVVTRLRTALVELRAATVEDAELLFAWADDPLTRSASFSTDRFSWESHVTWLRTRLADSHAMTLIATAGGDALGVVRFDRSAAGEYSIGITVAPEVRGRHWSAPMIAKAIDHFAQQHPGASVTAWIRPDNVASRKAFGAADFDEELGRASPDAVCYVVRAAILEA